MSGKPAARLGDSTVCPLPGHGSTPIAAGSPDVLLDGLPAARLGDPSGCGGTLAAGCSATVLVNGQPAAVVGSVGSHGNAVTSGSTTVTIGMDISPATSRTIFTQASLATAAAAAVPEDPSAQSELNELEYTIMLKPGGNHVLTPLMISDYEERTQGRTNNKENIDFLIRNTKHEAEHLTLEVFSNEAVMYTEANTDFLLKTGEHEWQWDGYSTAGVLDTNILKNTDIFLRLTASLGSKQWISELHLKAKAQEVEWVDVRIERNSFDVTVTVRPSFSDGGIEGRNNHIDPASYPALETLAKEGIEFYWSRNGDRAPGIADPIQTGASSYRVKVNADVNQLPKAKNFPLVENLTADGGRSTSFGVFRKIHHNLGYAYTKFVSETKNPSLWPTGKRFTDELFKQTAAHEFGHLILNEYGDGGLMPTHSWTHKNTSTLWQTEKPNNPMPKVGEIDLMRYYSTYLYWEDRFSRTVASDDDVKGLIWLSRVQFHA